MMLLNQLKKLAEDKNNILLLGELAIIEAKISLLTKNIDTAFQILQEFKEKAVSKKFIKLQTKIEDEVEQLKQIVMKWDELASIDSTVKQRLKQININEYIQQALSIADKQI